jgi:hypothetical protein
MLCVFRSVYIYSVYAISVLMWTPLGTLLAGVSEDEVACIFNIALLWVNCTQI